MTFGLLTLFSISIILLYQVINFFLIQKKLYQELKYFKNLLNKNPEPLVEVNWIGEILYSNKSFRDIFGENKKKITDIFFPDTPSQDGCFSQEKSIELRDGKMATFLISYFETTEEMDDDQEKRVYIFKDIEAFKGLKTLQKKSENIKDLNKMVGFIAHEVNNPLMIMMAYCGRIDKEISKEGSLDRMVLKSCSGKIKKSVLKINHIIKLMRSILRTDGRLDLSKIDLEGITREALEVLTEKVDISGSKIILNILDRNMEAPISDSEKLQQVLINLISNAIDATEIGKGLITINIQNTMNYFGIDIEDNGSGVKKSIRKEIFQPFFSTKGPLSGIGLGLSTSLALMEHLGGTLVLDEKLQEVGITRFSLKIDKKVVRLAC